MTDAPGHESALTAIAKRGVENSIHHAKTRRDLIDRLRQEADHIERDLAADQVLTRLLRLSAA